jgi:hypothetical protein
VLVIRDAQVRVLGAKFVQPLVELIRDALPEYYAAAGDEGAVELAHEAIAKSKQYGIVSCRDVGRYIAFMDALGSSFDTDPRYPWAGMILRSSGLTSEQKLAQLLAAALAT